MEFIYEIFNELPRLGPGSEKSTLKALSKIKLPQKPKILDIGCGNGVQTIVLAKNLECQIVAVDLHKTYLDNLLLNAEKNSVQHKIEVSNQSMLELNFQSNSYDIIWAESSIYVIGFEKGIKYFSNFLKPNGYLVVSEVCWIDENPPKEAIEFWNAEYPEMISLNENIKIIEKSELLLIDHFSLPKADWTKDFYKPLDKRIKMLQKKYSENIGKQKLLNQTKNEIDLYNKYSEYYGYEFFIIKKK